LIVAALVVLMMETWLALDTPNDATNRGHNMCSDSSVQPNLSSLLIGASLWRADAVLIAAACLGALLILLARLLGLSGSIVTFILIGAAAVAGIATWISNRRRAIDYHWVAEQIEVENPRLHTLLLAAVEQEPDLATGRLNYLQERVINEAVEENRRHPWHQKFSEKLVFARVGHIASLIAFLIVLAKVGSSPAHKGSVFRLSSSVTVTPGDGSVERVGRGGVGAFRGQTPGEVTLVGSSAAQPVQRIHLTKTSTIRCLAGASPKSQATPSIILNMTSSGPAISNSRCSNIRAWKEPMPS
jgi:hypothetical protein